MKWYWIVLIIVGVLSLGYLVYMNTPKKDKTTTPPKDTTGGPGGTPSAE